MQRRLSKWVTKIIHSAVAIFPQPRFTSSCLGNISSVDLAKFLKIYYKEVTTRKTTRLQPEYISLVDIYTSITPNLFLQISINFIKYCF